MWLSQHFVTVSANTIQPSDYTMSTSMFAFDKPLPAVPFTESDTDNTYMQAMNTSSNLSTHPESTLSMNQEPIVIVVIGHGPVDKSSLIQHVFPHYLSYHYQDITIGIRQHSYMVQINNESNARHVIFLEMDHILKHDPLTTSIHAALICYDVTQRLSVTGVPDLLNFYHSQQLPIYLLGLHSDSAPTRQVDYTFGEQLAQHFGVEFYEMKKNDVLTIHHMVMNLLRKCVSTPIITDNRTNSSSPVIHQPSFTQPPAYPPPPPTPTPTNIDGDDDTSIKMASSTTMVEVINQHPVENNPHHLHGNNQVRHLHHQDERMTATISTSEFNAAIPADAFSDDPTLDINAGCCPSVGFVYAPTAATMTGVTPTTIHDPPIDPSPPDKSISSSSRKTSTDNFAKFRRGSKDSGDSLGTGLSVDAIIDRLVTPSTGRTDELMIPIFVIFFRKFMSPYELIQVLIKRFENDICMPSLPTPLQQRITSVLVAWMTDYWCDFYHRQTRNQLHLFLGRLSALALSATSSSSLQPLLEKLYPLSLQPTPDFDPDNTWGRKDMDTVAIDHSKKKDSGYISSYLDASYTSLIPESSSASDIASSDCIWSRRPSAIGTPPVATNHLQRTPSTSTSPPPLQRPANYSSPMTSSAKLCAYSSLLNPSVTPDCFNGPIPSSAPTSRIHMAPSTSSPPSPPMTSSGSTTPASLTNSRLNDGYQHKTTIQITNSNKRDRIPTATSSSSASAKSLTHPEFAGGFIHVVSSKSPAGSQVSTDRSPTSLHSTIRSQPPRSRSSPNSPGMPMASSSSSPSPPPRRPYYPTGFTTSPQPSPSVDVDVDGSNAAPSARYMHQQMNQAVITQQTTIQPLPTPPKIDPAAIKMNTKLLLSLSNQEMAEQLTWIEAELFGKIKSREFVRMIWDTTKQPKQQERPNSMTSFSSEEQDDQAFMDHGISTPPPPTTTRTKSGLLASISHFNFISAWVVSMIVTQPKLGKRVTILEKFMTIAVALRDLNNYNSLMAILAGVNNAAILRMKHTQELIKKKKIYKRFQSLEKLMSSDRSYASYRIALKANTSYPSIPYLGIHSQDLIALDEANKDMKTDGTIHWDKFRLMGECIMMIIKLQQQHQPKHNLTPNSAILNWMGNCSILTEEEQYTQSVLIEPRLKAKSMTRLRDLWFR